LPYIGGKQMKEYITITKQEKKAIIIMTVILMLTNIILCFKGMALMQRYNEVVKEKEALEEIIQIQQEQLEGI